MRKIKFRAWDGSKMHEDVSPWRWDYVISNSWHRCEKSTGSGILGSGGNTAEMLVPAIRFKEIMQFTGLTDKNGKEIYEGDILKMYLDDNLIGVNEIVEFKYGAFWLRYRNTALHEWLNGEDVEGEVEVIGSIYENPELLHNEQNAKECDASKAK